MLDPNQLGQPQTSQPSSHRSQARIDLIKNIESLRGSCVFVYILGDRVPAGAQLSEDAIRPLYDHLISAESRLRQTKKADLFIYSRGGHVQVPWRIVSMFREFADEFYVLVPFKAYSAATLVALGADKIIMGKKGELGPIDPQIERTRVEKGVSVQEQIPAEDVLAYLTFLKRMGISDQQSLAQSLSPVAQQLGALTLGNVERISAHIRTVARKLLETRKEPLGENKIDSIVEILVERMYFHGHGISRKEAKSIGLPIGDISPAEDKALWELFKEYEKFLQLLDPIDPRTVFTNQLTDEHMIQDNICGVIESVDLTHLFIEDLQFLRVRDIPQLTLNINLPIQLPPRVQPQGFPANFAQQIAQQLLPQIQQQVREAVVAQSSVRGVTLNRLNGRWRLVS